MKLCYPEILHQNADFQRAVNLSFDQGSLSLVDKYIPTPASASIMTRYLKAAVRPGNDRASILIGPYGKGKSHTLFVILAVLSEVGEQADAVCARLADRLENVDHETSSLVREVRQSGLRLLPVLVNDRYLDVRQAFLASLKGALVAAGLAEMMPDNYYQRCLDTIERWHKAFPDTYRAYKQYLKANGYSIVDFESSLRQYDAAALSTFQACHKAILSGTTFDPLLESDVPTLYRDISDALCKQTEFSGLFIVFDEFGKYLESTVSGGDRFKALQDLAELCSRSTQPKMLLSCISHKAISEYASNLNQVQRSSFRTVEGRFEPIYFTTTFEGSFSLISGALGLDRKHYDEFIAQHAAEQAQTIQECTRLGCFAGYESSVKQIVEQCFPMHPLTTLSLMKLSERAAQNERTLFTFLSGIDSPLTSFIHSNHGTYCLAAVGMVYDYFHITIRENCYDKELRGTIIHADSLIPTLAPDDGELIKAIVLFSMVADNCLLSTKQTLMAALQWKEEHFSQVVQRLGQARHIYIRRSDGVICLMRSAAETVRQDIEHEMARRSRIDIATQFAELHDPGYTIPRRYNDQYEIVRFFQNVFVSTECFAKQPEMRFLSDYGFADGYVIYLLGAMDADAVQAVLRRWNDPRVVALLPTIEFTNHIIIQECAAIKYLLEHPADEVAAEELSYYFEDLMQMVNQTFAEIFDHNALLVTQTSVKRCINIGAEISVLCEEQLYPACPIICHEMMNRSVISGQMKQSRAKVIDAVLEKQDPLKAFPMKSAEGPIMNAVLGHLKENKMRSVIGIITEYIASCEAEKQPLKSLYDTLTSSPYGMRKGVIPILLAYCLKDKHQNAVLFNQGQELPLNGESMNALDEHFADYALLVDRGSADQAAYLQLLHDQYTPDAPFPEARTIYEAMCKIIRALPRSARANRKALANGQVMALLPSVIDVRSVLVRFDNNTRDALLNQLPKKTGFIYACKRSAQAVVSALQELCTYTKRLSENMKMILRLRMNGAVSQSTRGIMTVWLQMQPASHLSHSFSSPAASLLNIIRSNDNYTDSELMNIIAIALTGLPVEDWSDKQVEDFYSLLNDALAEIENVQDETEMPQDGARVILSVGGLKLDQVLHEQEMSGLTKVAYESVHSALNEFADSLSTDEKLLILANLMLHVNE